jgi:hypothetical protein
MDGQVPDLRLQFLTDEWDNFVNSLGVGVAAWTSALTPHDFAGLAAIEQVLRESDWLNEVRVKILRNCNVTTTQTMKRVVIS